MTGSRRPSNCTQKVRMVALVVLLLAAATAAQSQSAPRRIVLYWTDWGARQWSTYDGQPDFTGAFDGVFVDDPAAQILIRQRGVTAAEEQALESALESRIEEILTNQATLELEIRTVQKVGVLDVLPHQSEANNRAVAFTGVFLRILDRIQDRLAARGVELEIHGFLGSNGCYTSARSIPLLVAQGKNPVRDLVMVDSWALTDDMAALIQSLEQRVTLVGTVGDYPAGRDRMLNVDAIRQLKGRFPSIRAFLIDTTPGESGLVPGQSHISLMTAQGPVVAKEILADGTYGPARLVGADDLRRRTVYGLADSGEAYEERRDTSSCFPFCSPPRCPPYCPPFFPPDDHGGGGGAVASAPCPPYCPQVGGPPAGRPSASVSPWLVTEGEGMTPIWAGAPGGVDFCSLQLDYLAEVRDGQTTRLGYAFRADQVAAGGSPLSLAQAADIGSDAFFVWLVLPRETFWVNLNPAEPDRIIDAEFGKTDAGRILLEADLEMKKTVARLIHPDAALGQRFWDEIYQVIEAKGLTQLCLSFRQWIVPGQVTVLSEDGTLYIEKAALDVKMESEYLDQTGADVAVGSACPPEADPELRQYGETLFREMVLPELIAEVNSAPEYRELRNVFHSRIAAEWYRTQDMARGSMLFSDLIGRGTAEGWYSTTPWSPLEVYNRYVKSVTEGEFNITRESTRAEGSTIITTIRTYLYGGVDLVQVPQETVAVEKVLEENPDLADQLYDALYEPGGYLAEHQALLGGVYDLPEVSAWPEATPSPQQQEGESGDASSATAAAKATATSETDEARTWQDKLPCIGAALPAVLVAFAGQRRRRMGKGKRGS